MKKLTKLFTLAFALLCLTTFCFAGCGNKPAPSTHNFVEDLNGKTVAQVYDDIIATVDSYGSNLTATINYNIPCKITAKANGQSETVNYSITTTSVLKRNGNSFHEKVFMQQNGVEGIIPSQTKLTESYFVDNVAYINQNGSKNKLAGSLDQFAQYLKLDMDTVMNPIYDFSDTAFNDIKFAINKTNDSDIYFEVVLDGEEAEEFANKLAIGTNPTTGATLKLSKIKYRFIITKEGVLDHIDIDYKITMNMAVSGVSTVSELTFDGDITFTDVGTTTISAPEDADTYSDLGNIADYLY